MARTVTAMTNREKLYKSNIYDLIMELVTTRLHMCPISFLKGQKKDTAYCLKHKCSLCFNDWLNKESEG